MNQNYWESCRKIEFAKWGAIFEDRKMFDPYLALAFLTKVLAAGERERVLIVKQTEEPYPYHELMGISYAKHLENVLNEHGKMMFFEHLAINSPIYYWPYLDEREDRGVNLVSADLCYYDPDGKLTEGEVMDLGELLRQASNLEFSDKDPLGREMESNPPIEIYGELLDPQYRGTDAPLYLSFQLNSNIWHPQSYFHPNLELAMCHTPRLNRFLAEVRRLTLEWGGEWTFEGDCNEYGITLPETST